MCVCKNARFVGALYCQVRDDIRSSQILLMAVVSPQISVGHLEQYHASEGEQSSNVHKLCLCYEQKKVLRETNGQRKVWLVLVGRASCSLRIHIMCPGLFVISNIVITTNFKGNDQVGETICIES